MGYLPDKQIDVEGRALDSLVVEQILNDKAIMEQEHRLLRVKYKNPNASKAELAQVAGLKYHYEVTRIFDRVRTKLADYINWLRSYVCYCTINHSHIPYMLPSIAFSPIFKHWRKKRN